MSNIPNLPLLSYLNAPLVLAALQQQQQQQHQFLQQRTREVILERARNAVTGNALPLPPPRLTELKASKALSTSTKVDRGKSPPEWVNGAPVPTKLNNLRLKKSVNPPESHDPVADESDNERQRLRQHELLEAGLLSVTEKYPKEFPPNYRPNPLTDVVVGLGEALPLSHNVRFERLCACSLPSFQVAIRLRQGDTVKKIVGSIIRAVTHHQGSFVGPWEGTENCWREVCRNDAERFTLNELRRQNASLKAKAAALQSVTATSPVAALGQLPKPLSNAMTASGPFLRRVSPPDLQVPSRAALGESVSSEESSESTCDEDDISERPKKQAKRSEAESSALDALFLLSEAASRVDAIAN